MGFLVFRRIAILVLIAVLAPGTSAAPVAAVGSTVGGSSMGGTVVVDAGETVDGLDVVAGSVLVRGTVAGDLSGVAGNVVIADSGTVQGDVSLAAGAIRIAGTVEGSVSTGTGALVLGPTGSIAGDLSLGAETATIEGSVDGTARIGAEEILLGSTAQIGSDFRYDGTLTQESKATVGGSVVRDASIGGAGTAGLAGAFPSLHWVGTVYGLLANLLLGGFLLAVFPHFSLGVASRAADSPGRSALLGAVALLGVPVLLLAVALTLIGAPLALLGLFGYAFLCWVGIVYGEFAVGRWLLGRWQADPSRWWALLVGLVLFAALGALPFVGGLFILGALVLGLGALLGSVRLAYRRRRGRAEATTAPGPDASSNAV